MVRKRPLITSNPSFHSLCGAASQLFQSQRASASSLPGGDTAGGNCSGRCVASGRTQEYRINVEILNLLVFLWVVQGPNSISLELLDHSTWNTWLSVGEHYLFIVNKRILCIHKVIYSIWIVSIIKTGSDGNSGIFWHWHCHTSCWLHLVMKQVPSYKNLNWVYLFMKSL